MHPRPTTSPLPPGLSRRTVLGVTVAGAAGILTACGGSSGASTAAGSDPTSSAAGSSADPSSSSSESKNKSKGSAKGLVATAKVPVGAGVILKNAQIVVTQPTAGEFKAFSAICTHQSCPVSRIVKETIICDCHQSAYKISDGSTTVNPETGVKGPAPKALPTIAVKVEGDEIVKA